MFDIDKEILEYVRHKTYDYPDTYPDNLVATRDYLYQQFYERRYKEEHGIIDKK